jgi:hypothetical protein
VKSQDRVVSSRASVFVGAGAAGASFRTSWDIAFTTQKIAKEMITKLILALMNRPLFMVGAPPFWVPCGPTSRASLRSSARSASNVSRRA